MNSLNAVNVQVQDLKPLIGQPLAEIDQKYGSFIPPRLDELLAGKPEISYFDSIRSSGKGEAGLIERIRTQDSDEKKWIHDVEVLTSRWGDRESPVGCVIRCREGYWYCAAIFSGRGGYVSALHSLDDKKMILLCRGTATRWKATSGIFSGLNNLLWEPGMLAIQHVWPQIKKYLADKKIASVELYGKSQGGAHVQYLAPLIQKCTDTQVTSVVTYASIGVSERVEAIFYETFKNASLEIKAIFNEGDLHQHEIDFIPSIGGVHVGLRSKGSVYSIAPSSNRSSVKDLSQFRQLLEFLSSFRYGHTRQTTMKSYDVQQIFDTKSYFERGKELDGLRKIVAWIFYIFTLGFFYHVSYEDFLQKNRQMYEEK